MKLLLGVDGGGTKTAFLLTDQTGRTLAEDTAPGSSYKQIGIDPVAKQLLSGAKRCLDAAGAPWEALAGVCLGLPCLGESAEGDSALLTSLRRAFSTVALLNVNDAEVGFSGSLAGDEGVNIVAGTGSIAFGRNSRGETARCGGWSEFFGDEGSCYWAGRRTMELFSKEADGRLPKNALYEIIRMEFSLAEDFAFIDLMERAFLSSRRKVASLQPLLERAARAGDAAAAEIYRQAADELALIVRGVAGQLGFLGGSFPVSYSGGLFKAGDLVLPAFEEAVSALGGRLCRPLLSPVEGAVLLAARTFSPESYETARQTLLEKRG